MAEARPPILPRILPRILPGVRGLTLEPKKLLADLLAGLTLWAVAAPQAVAYAEIAHMPPAAALGMVPVAMAIYGFLGPSRRLVTAANSAVAITSATLVSQLAGDDPSQVVALSSALAIIAGGILFLIGITRLGFLADFIAMPVITGFLLGVGVLIILGQVHYVLGIPSGSQQHGWKQAVGLIDNLGKIHALTVALGLGALALLLVFGSHLHVPGTTLGVAVLGIVVGALIDLEAHGVQTIGPVPRPTLSPSFPRISLEDLRNLLVGAFGIGVIGFSETIAVARRLATPKGRTVHSNRELIALGAANLGAGFMGGFAVCGSLSATEVNQEAGARTSLASLFAAVFILLTGFFLGGVVRHLPQAVLGAIVIQAALGTIRIHSFAKFWQIRHSDFVLASVAFVGVCTLGILRGLLLAVLLSIGWLVLRASRAPYSVLGEASGVEGFEDLETNENARAIPGMLIFRFDAPLFFGNARRVHEILTKLVAKQKPRVVIVDMEMTFELDATAAEALVRLVDELEAEGVIVCFARVRAQPRSIFRKLPALAAHGHDRAFLTIRAAVDHHAAAVRSGEGAESEK